MEIALAKNTSKTGNQPDYKATTIEGQSFSAAAWWRTPMPATKCRVAAANLSVSFTADYEKIGSASLRPSAGGTYTGRATIEGVQYACVATETGNGISMRLTEVEVED